MVDYVKNKDFSSLKGVEYRFSKENDIIPIFKTLSSLYNESRGLEELFEYSWIQPELYLDLSEKYQIFLCYPQRWFWYIK